MKKYLLFLVALVASTMSFAQGTAEEPAVLNESQTFTMPGSGSWSHYYFSYTCELTGTLKFSGGSMFDVGVNAEASYDNAYGHYDNSEGKYVQKIDVTEGTTYTLDLYMYVGDQVTITLPHVMKDGDFEQPFNLNNGSVDLGSAAGTLWATYTADKSGRVTFAGNNGIVTSIRAFGNSANASYYLESGYDYSEAASETNELVMDVIAGKTYYVAITKVSSPMGNNFSATFKEFEPGESKEMPIDVSASMPYSLEVAPGAFVWVKVAETTEGEYKNFTFKPSVNTGLSVTYGYFYSYGTNKYWNEQKYWSADNVAMAIGSDWYNCEHLIKVMNSGEETATIALNVTAMEPGDSEKSPIELTFGQTYEITKDGDRYYSYTYSGGEVIAFELPEGATVECTSSYMTWYGTTGVEGNTYTFSYPYSGKFTFVVKGAKAGDTFKFVQGTLPEGSSQETAIDVTETGTYTFTSSSANVWVKYTAAEAGVIKVSSDLEVNFSDNVYVGTTTMNYLNTNSGKKYEDLITVAAGATLYVHAQVSNVDALGKTITFAPYVPGEGEVATTAIQVYKGDSFTVPAGQTRWYKFEATQTGNTIELYTSNSSISSYMYNCDVDGIASAYPNTLSYNDWGDGNGPMSTPYVKEGINIIKVYNYQEYDDVTLRLDGAVTTFHEHVYATEWSYNDVAHWHACTAVENCNEVSGYAAHEFDENRTCICGYVKPYAVTVANGTDTYSYGYFPIYGYYADTQGIKSSSVYDENLLAELKGKKITAIRYEMTNNVEDLTGTFQFNVTTSENNYLYDVPTDLGSLIYEGKVKFDGAYMTIPVDFTYEGGNLVITSTVAEAGNWVQTPWIGEYQDYTVSVCSYGASTSFLPKTTFIYAADEPAEETPDFTITVDVTEKTLTITPADENAIYMLMGGEPETYTEEVCQALADEEATYIESEEDLYAFAEYGYFFQGVIFDNAPLGWIGIEDDGDYCLACATLSWDKAADKCVAGKVVRYTFTLGTATGIDALDGKNNAVIKFVKDGKVILQKNGKLYNANGQNLK